MSDSRLRGGLCCFFLLVQGAHCNPPTGTSQFHTIIQQRAAKIIQEDVGYHEANFNGPALSKQALARRIEQAIKNTRSENGVSTIASFNLQFSFVVWQWDFPLGIAPFLGFGRPDPGDIYIKFGTREMYERLKAGEQYFPGLGSPSSSGASLLVSERMQDGKGMNCMIFYTVPGRLVPRLHAKADKFEGAVDACTTAEREITRLNGPGPAAPIDLNRFAACMHKASGDSRHHDWKGVAVVAATSLLQLRNAPHPEIGIWGPEGHLVMNHAHFQISYRGTLRDVYLHAFSLLCNQ